MRLVVFVTLFAAVALLEDEAGTALDALKASEPAAASVRVWDRVCRRGIAGGGSVTIGVACEGMGSLGRRFVVVVVIGTIVPGRRGRDISWRLDVILKKTDERSII